MSVHQPRSRALLIGEAEARATLRALMPSSGWDIAEAGGVEQASFVQANQPCDVVVLDGDLAGRDWAEALSWLGANLQRPMVMVSEIAVGPVLEAMKQGVKWLPMDVVRRHPELLAGMLAQAVWRGEERRRCSAAATQLRDAHGRIDRLLGLLWEAAPGEGPTRWYSQRHMLERLDEEVARLKRRGGELSLVLGELRAEQKDKLPPEKAQKLATMVAERLAEHKRRCDVAGRYGLDGFMLVLPRVGSAEAIGACQRLGKLLSRHDQHDLPPVHARFGYASAPEEAGSVQALLRRAEERLEETRVG